MTTERHRILIVEDSRTQAQRVLTILEDCGWDAVWTETADRAMEEVTRRLPDLILVDYELPGMRGDEFCRRLRMSVETRGVAILMLTSEETAMSEARGLESGADDYVSKGADPEMLVLRIRSLLREVSAPASILGPQESRMRRARLLAIDDSPTYLESLAAELGREGYVVEKASGGEEGLRRLAAEPFDCVLVDLIMPGVDGLEVCRRIAELRGRLRRHIGVLILTAHESKDEMSRGLEAGADDFVGKSSDAPVLKSRIRALLRRKQFQEENERILEELKNRELEAIRARAEKEAAEAKAALAGELQRTVEDLRRSRGEVLRLNQELDLRLAEVEAVNRELESFSYSVSHDLRAPLRAIDGFTQILAEDGGGLNDEGRRCVGRIRGATHRMAELIEDLLSLARVTRTEMHWTAVDLSAVAGEVVEALRAAQPARAVDVVIAPGLTAQGDARLLRVALENLVGNAWKFTGKKERARIEIGREEVEGRPACFVRDDGAGFDMAYAGQLFGPFRRLHAAGEFEGTGIGLATVQRVIRRHGGRVWAEGAVGHGATFHFMLGAPPEGASVLANAG